MSSGLDVFDESPVASGAEAGLLSESHVHQHSGHRLLCRACKDFQRTKVELVSGAPPVLRITCKTCGSQTDFELRGTGVMPKPFSERIRKFALARAKQILKEV